MVTGPVSPPTRVIAGPSGEGPAQIGKRSERVVVELQVGVAGRLAEEFPRPRPRHLDVPVPIRHWADREDLEAVRISFKALKCTLDGFARWYAGYRL
jgi:hypothetical protein